MERVAWGYSTSSSYSFSNTYTSDGCILVNLDLGKVKVRQYVE